MPFFVVRDRAGKTIGRALVSTAQDAIARIRADHPDADIADAVEDSVERDRLSQLIEDSGLSIAEFARTVVGRDERTVRRWLGGDVIPEQMAHWLARAEVESNSKTVTVRVQR